MLDFNVKFITLQFSSYIYNVSIIAPANSRCAGGKRCSKLSELFPLNCNRMTNMNYDSQPTPTSGYAYTCIFCCLK